MPRVVIVGAGQLGSRHLQALQGVAAPLDIHVVEPSAASARLARERFEAAAPRAAHRIAFHAEAPTDGPVDLAIVATGSDVRREAVDRLLDAAPVRWMVLEKLLFTRRDDYAAIGERLEAAGTRAWVNCCMRVMPPYERIRSGLAPGPLHYRVTGSQYGLVTNAIHYLDHVVHLTGAEGFTVDTAGLDPAPIDSKRRGYLELNGTLVARFAGGSRCEVTCFAAGTAPVVVEISSEHERFIVRESEGRLWHSSAAGGWAWAEEAAPVPFQSQMTTRLVQRLLEEGECGLAPYAASERIHLALLEALAPLVRDHAAKGVDFPFT
jgi:predicted dehydrogenase